MKRVNFKDVVFEPMIICGIKGLFTSLRVDKSVDITKNKEYLLILSLT